MSRYKITDQHGINFVTLTVVDWVDVFIRKQYKDILLDSLRCCQKEKDLQIFAYVIMSSHIHLIVRACGKTSLSNILWNFKKFTARHILNEIENGGYESRKEWMLRRFSFRAGHDKGDRRFQFWQTDNHPIELYSLHVIAQKIDYIHNNPVKEGWVASPELYLYSSASNYTQDQGVLQVEIIDLPMSWIGYVP